MGQGKSKNPGPKDPQRGPRNTRKGSDLLEIPQDSPLGLMIKHWDTGESRKDKSKEKIIQYCMEEWTKEPIRPDHLYWPIFGSFDDWICPALNIYVNAKEPFSQEESDYAALWTGSSKPALLWLIKEKGKNWEPLDHLDHLSGFF